MTCVLHLKHTDREKDAMPQTPRQRKANHWILTICTGGLWAPVWMLDWASRDH